MPEIDSKFETIDFQLLGKAGQAPKTYTDGEYIFRTGGGGKLAYVVESGCVELSRDGIVLEQVGPGIIFGEMALIEPGPRIADAKALGETSIVSLNRRTFLYLIGEQPKFSLNVLRLIARRIKATPW